MNSFIKENWFKVFIILIILVMAMGYFYWKEYRPSQIKKECSWTKVVEAAQPEITAEEAQQRKEEYEKCREQTENLDLHGFEHLNRLALCGTLIQERDYIPEKTYYRKATEEEYIFCIHEKGL